MALPPIRSRILQYLSVVGSADVSQIQEALKPEYGTERQFTRKALDNHLMNLKENGLLTETGFDVIDGQLETNYTIDNEGRKLVTRYMKKFTPTNTWNR